jgi:hypothetical protein
VLVVPQAWDVAVAGVAAGETSGGGAAANEVKSGALVEALIVQVLEDRHVASYAHNRY